MNTQAVSEAVNWSKCSGLTPLYNLTPPVDPLLVGYTIQGPAQVEVPGNPQLNTEHEVYL